MFMPDPLFAFDLDGTVTTEEILPRLAREIGLEREMALLTRLTLDGSIDFEVSFRLRFHLLRHIPLGRAREIVVATPLDPAIAGFIREHAAQCVIMTGNVDCWIEPLLERLNCACWCSKTAISEDGPRLVSILDKGRAVRELKKRGHRVIAIGESANDVPMFREADMGIAYAGVHEPAEALKEVAGRMAANGKELCAMLAAMA